MKKLGFGSRVLSLLLAVTIIVSLMAPMVAYAAKLGDIEAGDTGLEAGVNANDTISWPIKIYDYLNDGMLFEYSSAQDYYAPGDVNGGAYYGGQNVPMLYEDGIIGIDYTVSDYYDYNGAVLTRKKDGTAQSTGESRGYGTRYWGNKSYAVNPDGNGAIEVTRSVVKAVDNQNPMYLHLDYTADTTSKSYGWFANFAQDNEQYYTGDQVRYMVIVYRTNAKYAEANDGMGRTFRQFWAVSDKAYSKSTIDISSEVANHKYGKGDKGRLDNAAVYLTPSTDTWTFQVVDMKTNYPNVDYGIADNWTIDYDNDDNIDIDLSKQARVAGIGMCFPLAAKGEAMDISHIAFFGNEGEAERFGANAVRFDNDPGYFIGRTVKLTHAVSGKNVATGATFGDPKAIWNMGNNEAFTMLYASAGGGWTTNDSTYGSVAGGTNTWNNGYFSYPIGYDYANPNSKENLAHKNAPSGGYDGSENIFLLRNAKYPVDMSKLKLGYTLYNDLTRGVMTAGLLESGLTTETGLDGKTHTIMQYKDETIYYIAYLLNKVLVIPERDGNGPNYNFVKGTENGEQYGYADDEKTQPYDLASALRAQLGIEFTKKNLTSTDKTDVRYQPDIKELGSSQDTRSRLYDEQGRNKLIGPYLTVKDNIETFHDAAYYLLHNLFVADSYNQAQDEYNYLVLARGDVKSAGKPAYVFDAGFTDADKGNSGVIYDPIRPVVDADGNVVTDENGNVKTTGSGTIKLSSAAGKDMVYYTSTAKTTRFPFLPVTHSEGAYAIGNDRESYLEYGTGSGHYFQDDGTTVVADYAGTYSTRNYNYVMTSHGEFIYHKVDQLFFDFEGDDDVYLFINGELVLDIGAAHSITAVGMDMNEYVENSKKTLKSLSGYYDGIPDAAFEELISGLSDAKKAEYTRAHKLNLLDGNTYTFDFFYMERHGWGANCRIATNIVVTDPALKTRKTAYQEDTEIPFGGVVDPDERYEYSFAVTNEGNSKLYNLTFKDENIGVTLDPKSGLVKHSPPVTLTFDLAKTQDLTIHYPVGKRVAANLDGNTSSKDDGEGTLSFTNVSAGKHTIYFYQITGKTEVDVTFDQVKNTEVTLNGTHITDFDGVITVHGVQVMDFNGDPLDVEDLIFYVDGFYDEDRTQPTPTIEVTFRDDEGAGTVEGKLTAEEKLKNFLCTLAAPGTALDTGTSSNNYHGDGLWRHATLTVRGIWYKLTDAQEDFGVFNNTVYTTATPAPYSTAIIKGEAHHRVYVGDEPKYYQWAGHNLFLSNQKMLNDAGAASTNPGSQLNEYSKFFESVLNEKGDAYQADLVNIELCDVMGASHTYDHIQAGKDSQNNVGYYASYPSAGIYNFYVLMYLKSANREDLQDGQYAIVCMTVVSTSVADSTFVLDYGLQTAHLDANGELFKNDKLFGGFGSNEAKLMGISTSVPSYRDASNAEYGIDYNRIGFIHQNANNFGVTDGHFTMTVNVGDHGKLISYNAFTGQYSLTEVGTVKLSAEVPEDWAEAYLYFWYDDLSNNGWPGTPMNREGAGEFYLNIPADVTNFIISNGAGVQSVDLRMTPGLESVAKLLEETDEKGHLLATVGSAVEFVTIHAKIPGSWSKASLYYWVDGKGTDLPWPGDEMTDADSDGWLDLQIPGNINRVVVNDGGNGKQTWDLIVTPGKDAWVDVSAEDTVKQNTVTAEVPADWENAYIYYWYDDGGNNGWPGTPMSKQSAGKFTLQIPGNAPNMIIHNGSGAQTVDLRKTAGLDAVVKLNDENSEGKYQASVDSKYNAVIRYSDEDFTVNAKVPADWTSAYLYYWYSDGTATGVAWPGLLMEDSNQDGWYDLKIPVGVTHIIISNGPDSNAEGFRQSVNLSVLEGADAWVTISSTTQTLVDEYGNMATKHLGSVAMPGLSFTPTDFMDEQYSLYLAVAVHDVGATPNKLGDPIDINNQVQMYKKVTVLPANVVYYEDNFPAIHYVQETGDNVNVFEDLMEGNGGTDLKQDVDQDSEYGSDPTYDNNSDMSGNTTKKITIRKSGDIAYFTFTGTGFEMISRTNADKYATINLSVYAASDVEVKADGTISYDKADRKQYIPLVTEFDQGGDGGTEVIYQVPVIRVNDLTLGSYTVIIAGTPSRDWENKFPGNDWDPANPAALPEIVDSYLYIDGLRIYEPLEEEDSEGKYNAEEQGATFDELRELVVNGYAALATYDGANLSVGSGTHTWTENRDGVTADDGSIAMDYTKVTNVTDYLTDGPNNEVYMCGATETSAIVFYVKEDAGSTVHNLQIAVHAVDMGLFHGAGSTGMNSQIVYGVKNGEEFAWKALVTTTSGTEQYYTIDYTQCPKDANGYYQVAVKAETGMASFTGIKYNGLLINSLIGEKVSVKFNNGVLTTLNPTTGAWIDSTSTEVPMFLSLRRQLMVSMDSSTEETPIAPSEPEETVGIELYSASLSMDEETFVNIYFTGTDLEDVELTDMGLLTWSKDPGEGTVDNAEKVYSGAVTDANGRYMVRTGGIPAKMLADDIVLRVYVKLADGSYVYSKQITYSPKIYAMSRLQNSDSEEMKALCVALLNYGAAAQKYFGYKTDALMNADLTEEQLKLAKAYSADMVATAEKPDAAKAGAFAQTQGFSAKSATVSMEGSFAINYYFTPSAAVDGDMTFYYWTGADYANAEALTAENATGVMTMTQTGGKYWAQISGIAAKEFDAPLYVAAVYESDGQQYCTGVSSYSLSTYFVSRVAKGSDNMKELAAAAVVYGFYAKTYFAQ